MPRDQLNLWKNRKICRLFAYFFLSFLAAQQLTAAPGHSHHSRTEQRRVNTVSDEERSEIKSHANRLRNQGPGVLITPIRSHHNSPTNQTRNYLQGILDNFAGRIIEQNGIHVRLNLYSTQAVNAFATRGTSHRYLGLAGDGKPIFEIGFNQGLLPIFHTADEIAFIMGHELGHIISGHIAGEKMSESDIAEHWYSSQANEVEADFFALNAMRGHYELDAGYSIMERILPDDVRKDFASDITGTHHHPSVRLASLLARTQQLRRTDPQAAPRTETPIPEGALWFQRSARSNPVSQNVGEYREEYLRWFDSFMAPRTERVYLSSSVKDKIFKEFPKLRERSLYRDATNALFRESLTRIEGMNHLSRAERLERVFELLAIYKELIYAKVKLGAQSAIVHLSNVEMAALRSSLLRLTFPNRELGEHNLQIDAPAIFALFETRVQVYNSFTVGELSTRDVFRNLISFGRLENLFQTLAKSTARWRRFHDEAFHFDEKMPLRELAQLLVHFKDKPLPDPAGQRLLEVISRYDYQSVYEQADGLDAMEVFLRFHDKLKECKWPALCAQLEISMAEQRPHFRDRLLEKLNESLQTSPAALSREDLFSTMKKIDSYFDNGSFRKGLLPEDTINHPETLRRLRTWIHEVEQLGLRGGWQSMANQLQKVSASHLLNAMRGDVWPHSERMPIYLSLARSGNIRAWSDDSALSAFSTEELRAIVFRPRATAGANEEFLKLVSDFLELPVEDVRRQGLTRELLVQRWKGMTEEQIEEHTKRHHESSKIQSLLWSIHYEHELPIDHILTSAQNSLRILPTLTAGEMESLVRDEVEIKNETNWRDLLLFPHLLNRNDGGYGMPGIYRGRIVGLIRRLVQLQDEGIAFDQWNRILNMMLSAHNLEISVVERSERQALGRYFSSQLKNMPAAKRLSFLDPPVLLGLLTPDQAAHHLSETFLAQFPPATSFADKSVFFLDLQKRLKLPTNYPAVNHLLEAKVAEGLRLQPGEIARFYSAEQNVHVSDFGGHIRGISGIVGHIQTRSVADQMEFIEYMLGRKDEVPTCVLEISEHIRKEVDMRVDFENIVTLARARLINEPVMVRALSILPFYTGGSSILGHKNGTQALVDEILKSVKPEHHALASELAHGILRGEGRNSPMAFALLFAQRGENNRPLTEAAIFNSLFNGYGVPGIKFGQYLAFTSEMGALRENLASIQDQAMPISYLDAIKLLESRFPLGLPDGLEVRGIKGSGSVNIGVEYYNPTSRRSEIISVTRAEIESATREDFRRLRSVINSLTSTPQGQERYGFMLGLDRVIQQSVELEFNRPQVFENHAQLHRILNRTVDGWQVRMVEPYTIENGVIQMQMAKGTPARLVESADPALYRTAMKAASTVMTDHLLQQDGAHSAGKHFADSDFHNGQVFIDKRTRTVWLIDPGQSVPISEAEFSMAKQVLRIISRSLNANNALNYINESALNPHPGTPFLNKADLSAILANAEPADAFIKFIGAVEQRGGRMPLPVVQWVLGMNRQIALSKHLGFDVEQRLFRTFLADSARSTLGLGDGGSASGLVCVKDALQTALTGLSHLQSR